MRNRLLFILGLLTITAGSVMAQFSDYHYIRPIRGVADQWHSLALPDDMYSKISPELNDIRIIEIKGADTLEVPYLVKVPKPRYEELSFELINQTKNSAGFYYTFKVDAEKTVDQIKLNFNQPNFDLNVTLEGSQDQKEWFNIVEDYRMVSIKNNLTDYQFTTLKFPKAQFSYYRLFVPTSEDPDFQSAGIKTTLEADIKFRHYEPVVMNITEDKQNRETVLTADFEQPVLLSSIAIDVADSVDYYRPFTIHYLKDSFETEKGWKYNYATLGRSTLSSLENNTFSVRATVAQKLKITVSNYDNRPLTIQDLEGIGEVSELIARFEAPGDYHLLYGHSSVRKPNYDIKNFQSSIPADLKPLELGKEQFIYQSQAQTQPLFTSKWWFWGIMIAVMGLLGWFSVKMVKGS